MFHHLIYDSQTFCVPFKHHVLQLCSCWKEQLSAAKDARTFDIFQYRLLLSYRLLKGTNRHRDVHGPIEQAVKKVDAELSQLATGSLQRLRCNENMLSCKEEVQRLINLALEKADTRGLASGATKHAGLFFKFKSIILSCAL